MSHTVPATTPIAALRTMRRAAHHLVTFDELLAARTNLAQPMGLLFEAWLAVIEATAIYERHRTAESWEALELQLARLDETLTPLFGPSGWT